MIQCSWDVPWANPRSNTGLASRSRKSCTAQAQSLQALCRLHDAGLRYWWLMPLPERQLDWIVWRWSVTALRRGSNHEAFPEWTAPTLHSSLWSILTTPGKFFLGYQTLLASVHTVWHLKYFSQISIHFFNCCCTVKFCTQEYFTFACTTNNSTKLIQYSRIFTLTCTITNSIKVIQHSRIFHFYLYHNQQH